MMKCCKWMEMYSLMMRTIKYAETAIFLAVMSASAVASRVIRLHNLAGHYNKCFYVSVGGVPCLNGTVVTAMPQ